MCGLNGIFAYRASAAAPSRAELAASREHMAARGPDGSGEWWSACGRCALGFRRLAIQDLSERGAQPMVGEDQARVIVFNGEIYNFRALRDELERHGRPFRSGSDTEVLLRLYEAEGAGMVRRLRGMYAFAIWDETRRGLLLGRDPYGIKPLYTSDVGGTFRFASQVKALLAGGAVGGGPEPAGVVGFHLYGSAPEPFTLHRDIRALPAGHTQWVDADGPCEPAPFADLAEVLAAGARAPLAEAPAERVRAAVLDSVRAHLVADVEVGVFLSAGVDSGALLGLMRDAGQHQIRAITLCYDEYAGTGEDEAPLAAAVAQRYGASHVVRRVAAEEFRADLPAILEAMDQPSIDGVNSWFVSKAAREAGLKVALSGVGGDELLGGYPSFRDLPRWRRRLGPIASIPGAGRLARALVTTLAPGFARARPKALGLLEYSRSWAGAYLLRRGLFLPHELPAVMDPELAREGLARLRPLRRLSRALSPDPGSDAGRVCALESAHYLRNQLLRDCDWAGMAHSLEIRTPLVDAELLRALAPVVPRLAPGEGKRLLAAAPSTPLPGCVTERAKTGFSVPMGQWLGRRDAGTASAKGLASRNLGLEVFAQAMRAPSC
ncbi:MAG: asparagine synthase (glutamine-hydrolyzing) [Caulobacteraceae bacterium]|nr:asparagine synthase (glutamine-hydrolyzing) [Caulobacteraceae bacterium]